MPEFYRENPDSVKDHPYTLKSVHFSERFSDDSNCFDGKLYQGNLLVATVGNRGNGGPTEVNFMTMPAEGEAKEYVASLPVRGWYNFNDDRGEIEDHWNVETLVDELFADWLEKDSEKKYRAGIKRAAKTKLLVAYDDIDPATSYAVFPRCVYGQEFKDVDRRRPVQDILRDRMIAEGKRNIRIYNPETQEWED
jgi:hypothetical protein